jgi:hypothetical protein
MVSIVGKTVAVIKAISNKVIETVMEFGQDVLQIHRRTKVTIYLTRKMDMVFTIGQMGTVTRAVSWKINDVDRANCSSMIS